MSRFLYPDPDLSEQPPLNRQLYFIEQLAKYDRRDISLTFPMSLLGLGGVDFADQNTILTAASSVNGFINMAADNPGREVIFTIPIELPSDGDTSFISMTFHAVMADSREQIERILAPNHQPLNYYNVDSNEVLLQEPHETFDSVFGIKLDPFENLSDNTKIQLSALFMDSIGDHSLLLYEGVVIYNPIGPDEINKRFAESFMSEISKKRNKGNRKSIIYAPREIGLVERLLGKNPWGLIRGAINDRRKK